MSNQREINFQYLHELLKMSLLRHMIFGLAFVCATALFIRYSSNYIVRGIIELPSYCNMTLVSPEMLNARVKLAILIKKHSPINESDIHFAHLDNSAISFDFKTREPSSAINIIQQQLNKISEEARAEKVLSAELANKLLDSKFFFNSIGGNSKELTTLEPYIPLVVETEECNALSKKRASGILKEINIQKEVNFFESLRLVVLSFIAGLCLSLWVGWYQSERALVYPEKSKKYRENGQR